MARAIFHTEQRDVAVALAICNCEKDAELIVHKQNGEIDYKLSPDEITKIQKKMYNLLKKQGE